MIVSINIQKIRFIVHALSVLRKRGIKVIAELLKKNYNRSINWKKSDLIKIEAMSADLKENI